MKKLALFSICLAFAFFACERQDTTLTKNFIELTSEQKQVVSSSNLFGFNIFEEVIKNSDVEKNVFISPLSISMALTMLYNGAGTITKDELQEGLGYQGLTDEQVNVSNRDLIKALTEIDPLVTVKVANSIWHKSGFYVEPAFLEVNRKYFDAVVLPGTFSNATKDSINDWVADKTNQKITDILDEIRPDVVMYLINAIYFNGTWKYKFDPNNTQDLDFNLSDGTKVKTGFMKQEGSFEFYQNDVFSAIDLPYSKGNYSMLVLLPKSGKTCDDILKNLGSSWNTLNENLTLTNIKVVFPKFKFEFYKKLNDDLSALGMSSMFGAADLSGINKYEHLQVTRVLHKAFVDVNEKGTEAAAATVVEIGKTAYPSTPEFKADKPFIFIIRENDTNTLLFMGVMNNPLLEK